MAATIVILTDLDDAPVGVNLDRVVSMHPDDHKGKPHTRLVTSMVYVDRMNQLSVKESIDEILAKAKNLHG